MSKTIKHFKTEKIMVLHEGKNDQWDSGAEFPALALMPLDFDGSSLNSTGYTNGYTDDCDTLMPFFAFGDSDEDDEDDMDDDDFDDNDFDDDADDFDDEKDEFNFIKDDYDEDIDDDDEDLDDDDDFDDDDEE
jgi:hypothetical protein